MLQILIFISHCYFFSSLWMINTLTPQHDTYPNIILIDPATMCVKNVRKMLQQHQLDRLKDCEDRCTVTFSVHNCKNNVFRLVQI